MSPAATAPKKQKNKTSLPLQANIDLIKIPLFLFNRRHSIDKKHSVYLWLIIIKDKFNQSFFGTYIWKITNNASLRWNTHGLFTMQKEPEQYFMQIAVHRLWC